MLQFNNDDTVAVHITQKCNIRCEHCYQEKFNNDLSMEKALRGLDVLKPKNIMFYGGEPLVRPQTILSLMKKYPNSGYIIQTNGTIFNEDVLDRMGAIYLTLESFFFEKNPVYRPVNKIQYRNIMKIVDTYKDKLYLIHNIYPKHNDESFYRIAKLLGVPVLTYPVVMNCSEHKIPVELYQNFKINDIPLTKPKLRILENGTITRDMRGVYNICQPEDWREEYREASLPTSSFCKESCKYNKSCPAYSTFPHFCKDILHEHEKFVDTTETCDKPFFCKIAQDIYEINRRTGNE